MEAMNTHMNNGVFLANLSWSSLTSLNQLVTSGHTEGELHYTWLKEHGGARVEMHTSLCTSLLAGKEIGRNGILQWPMPRYHLLPGRP
jgi:hypothetical protein